MLGFIAFKSSFILLGLLVFSFILLKFAWRNKFWLIILGIAFGVLFLMKGDSFQNFKGVSIGKDAYETHKEELFQVSIAGKGCCTAAAIGKYKKGEETFILLSSADHCLAKIGIGFNASPMTPAEAKEKYKKLGLSFNHEATGERLEEIVFLERYNKPFDSDREILINGKRIRTTKQLTQDIFFALVKVSPDFLPKVKYLKYKTASELNVDGTIKNAFAANLCQNKLLELKGLANDKDKRFIGGSTGMHGDNSKGSSGGPLLIIDGFQSYAAGISSFGFDGSDALLFVSAEVVLQELAVFKLKIENQGYESQAFEISKERVKQAKEIGSKSKNFVLHHFEQSKKELPELKAAIQNWFNKSA